MRKRRSAASHSRRSRDFIQVVARQHVGGARALAGGSAGPGGVDHIGEARQILDQQGHVGCAQLADGPALAVRVGQLLQQAGQPLGRLALLVGAFEAQAFEEAGPPQQLGEGLVPLQRHVVGADHGHLAFGAQAAKQTLDAEIDPVIAGGEAVAPELALRVEHQDAQIAVGGEAGQQLRGHDRLAAAGLAEHAQHHRLAKAARLSRAEVAQRQRHRQAIAGRLAGVEDARLGMHQILQRRRVGGKDWRTGWRRGRERGAAQHMAGVVEQEHPQSG